MCRLTSRFKPQPRQESRLTLAGFDREVALMVKKELREPSKGVGIIGARSCQTEAGAELYFCTHTLGPCNIATDSS